MKIAGHLGMVVAAAGIALAPHGVGAAGKFDGSVPMLCVPTVVTECGIEGDCRRGTAASVNLPEFLKVDLKAMKVYAEGTGRMSSTISTHTEGFIIFGVCTLLP